MKIFLIPAVFSLFAMNALASTDITLKYFYPYQDPQGEKPCLERMNMIYGFGLPEVGAVEAGAKPVSILKYTPMFKENIEANLLVSEKVKIAFVANSNDYTQSTYNFLVTIPPSVRRNNLAKIAAATIAKNFKEQIKNYSEMNWVLKVSFANLKSLANINLPLTLKAKETKTSWDQVFAKEVFGSRCN